MPELTQQMLAEIEQDLQTSVASYVNHNNQIMIDMMRYHMGWIGDGAGKHATGKRLRPLFLLLSYQGHKGSDGEDWKAALPAASAVELIHNFSLIHDDIEDHSELRRGRRTVWNIWGVPQAINTGDAMFSIAHHTIHRLSPCFQPAIVAHAAEKLLKTCIDLTNGQYLDMDYETRQEVAVKDYWPMIEGKTAALLSACAELGAMLAGSTDETLENTRKFGIYLGLAFQVQDDILGIWGEESKTGKSSASDIVTRKKSFPILLSLSKKSEFFELWQKPELSTQDISKMTQIMRSDGTFEEVRQKSDDLTKQALRYLELSAVRGKAGEMIGVLTHQLLDREI